MVPTFATVLLCVQLVTVAAVKVRKISVDSPGDRDGMEHCMEPPAGEEHMTPALAEEKDT